MNTKLLKLICSMGLLCVMLVANAAWTINPVTGKNWKYQISDGNWTIGCDLLDENGNLTIGAKGRSDKCVVEGSGDLDFSSINTDLDTDEIDYTLTQIASCAFENANIVNCTLPKTVTSIGWYSFKKGITGSFTIEEGSELTHINPEAFNGSGITSINLHICTKLQYLGKNAFRECRSLTSIGTGELPASLELLEQAVFYNCTALTGDIWSDATMKWQDGEQFRYTDITSLVVPNIYGALGARVMGSCASLTNVVLSAEVTAFGERVRESANAIVSWEPKTYPKVTSLGSHFMSGLSSIDGDWVFPELLTMVGTDHFKGTKITSFKAPKIQNIAGYSFQNCYSLKTMVLSQDVTSFGKYSLTSCTILENLGVTEFPVLTFLGDHALSSTPLLAQEFSAPIYEGTTSETYIFENSGITKMIVPSLTKTATGMFYNMKNLEELTVSEKIESFSSQFAQGDNKLVKVEPTVFPNLITIGNSAFRSCNALQGDFNFQAATSIGGHAFSDTKTISSIVADKVVNISSSYTFENSSATNISLKSVMNIPGGCFQGCNALQELTLNSAITNIGGSAFNSCQFPKLTPTKFNNLKYLGNNVWNGNSTYAGSIDLKKSTDLTIIYDHTFAACTKISEIKLPPTITDVQAWAFEKVMSADIYFYGPRPTFFGNGVFKYQDNKKWNNIVIMPEHIESWTVTDSLTTFTPLENVPESQLANEYPTVGKVLGTISFTTGDNATHWLTKYISPTTLISIR
ncbi:MAG: leucine-rich repeat protein [Kiritimatiellae bacterium]|nr:leucine-rich repeat protein [Kiritimatiellia bacterium]